MAAASDIREWLKESRKGWLVLAQGTLWLVGMLGTFLLPPPAGILASEDKIWLRLGQFIVTIVLGLVFLAGRRWHQKRHTLWWSGAAILFLASAVGVFFRYQQLTLAWTAVYAGQKVVIGSELTAAGRADIEKNPGISSAELIMEFAGKTESIWTRESLNRRRLVLAASYISCLPLFTLCLMALMQAIQCGRTKSDSTRARAHKPRDKAARSPRRAIKRAIAFVRKKRATSKLKRLKRRA